MGKKISEIAFLAFAFFSILLIPGFGDEVSKGGSFSDYINSPQDNSEASNSEVSVNKSVSLNQAPNDTPVPKPEKENRANRADKSEDSDSKSALPGIPARWRSCNVNSDCTAGVADCVSWDALNKKYLPKLAKNLKSCSESVDPGFQPQAVCVDKECQTTDQMTDVSWDEWLEAMRKEK